MRKTIAIFIIGVMLPALALAVLGLWSGDGFVLRQLESLKSRNRPFFEEAVAGFQRTLAERLDRAAVYLRTWRALSPGDRMYPLIFLTQDGRRTGRPPAGPASPNEARLFQRCLLGGQQKEYQERDFQAAADAYTFFLSSLKTPDLRATVICRAARALQKGGQPDLAKKLFQDVVNAYPGAMGPDGEPVDALAWLSLVEMGVASKEEACAYMEKAAATQSPAFRDIFYGRLQMAPPPQDQVAEAAVSVLPERQTIPRAFAFGGRFFLFNYMAETAHYVGTWVDLAVAAPDLPAAPTLSLSFQPMQERRLIQAHDAVPVHRAVETELAARLVRSAGGLPLGYAVSESPDVLVIRQEAARRRFWAGAVVVALLVITLLAGTLVLKAFRAEMQLVRLKSEFIANVSHEMKTPLSAVRMFAEMIADDALPADKVRQYAGVLKGESERLTGIVENILDFSRLERGGMALEMAPVDLAELLKGLSDSFTARAVREGIIFKAVYNGVGTIQSNGDALSRILQNFLDNAFKYQGKERGAPAAQVLLTARQAGDAVHFAVEDSGMGMTPAEVKRIFEKFYRSHPEDVAIRGTGMGLSLAAALAERIGGAIQVESKPGAGSVFRLTVPVAVEGENA